MTDMDNTITTEPNHQMFQLEFIDIFNFDGDAPADALERLSNSKVSKKENTKKTKKRAPTILSEKFLGKKMSTDAIKEVLSDIKVDGTKDSVEIMSEINYLAALECEKQLNELINSELDLETEDFDYLAQNLLKWYRTDKWIYEQKLYSKYTLEKKLLESRICLVECIKRNITDSCATSKVFLTNQINLMYFSEESYSRDYICELLNISTRTYVRNVESFFKDFSNGLYDLYCSGNPLVKFVVVSNKLMRRKLSFDYNSYEKELRDTIIDDNNDEV